MVKKPSPKLALRAWLRWRAGQPEFPADLEREALAVELDMKNLIADWLKPSRAKQEQFLAKQLTRFEAAYAAWKEKPD
jgi:hypothetical protein